MTVKELYYKGLDKLNKLVSNNQQDVPYHIFTQNWNEQQLHWVSNCYKLDEKNKSEIHKIQQLLLPHIIVSDKSEKQYYTEFDFPKNYFKYSSSYTNINKCPYKLENHLIESHNNNLLKDPDWSPSLKFEETLIQISNNKFLVYFNNEFKPETLELSYYRFPNEIQIEDGHTDFNGNQTKDIMTEWTGDNLEEILDLTVESIASNYSDEYRRQTITNHIQQTQIRI